MQEIAAAIRASDDPAQLTALTRDLYTTLQPCLEAVGKLYASGKEIQDKLAGALHAQQAEIKKARKAL